MAQPNVNREPTMEEILASIRRIIESNDTGDERRSQVSSRDRGDELAMLEQETTAGALAADEGRRQGQAGPSFAGVAEGQHGSGPVSLAEVAARVRASGSSAAPVRPSVAPAVLASVPVQGSAAVRLDQEADPEEDDEPADERTIRRGGQESIDVAARQDDEEVVALAGEPPSDEEGEDAEAAQESDLRSVLRTAESALPTSVGKEPGRPDFRGEEPNGRREGDKPMRLISASVGAKVAAAFGDLNDAFSAGPRRSFDEMAEEMLRPMLTQWLDDNLPTLVERLVREEIERVARGGRR